MAEESDQHKKADCTDVQRVWNQTDLVIQKICTFLGPFDLCSFRLVCTKWKDESTSIWKHHRTRHILHRFSKLGLKSSKSLHNPTVPNMHPEPLTVFSEYRPSEMECNFDIVAAEELRDFFSRAKKDDAKLKKTSFLFIKLKKWNRFGSFPSGIQEGAKWFLNEVDDKVVHLTLDECNLSISQGEFFPTLCKMTQLKELIIRGTCFQLRKSAPVKPTLAEITPLPKLKVVEMNYENFTEKWIPKYNFPWDIFLGVIPELSLLAFSFSNWRTLAVAVVQFSKVIKMDNSVNVIIFKNLLGPNQEPIIPKTKVKKIVQKSLEKLEIENSILQSLQPHLPPTLKLSPHYKFDIITAKVKEHRWISIKFQDHEDGTEATDPRVAKRLLQEIDRIQNGN